MEQLSPILLQSNDVGAKEQKTRHFDIIEVGGGVVQMFHLLFPRLNLAQYEMEQLSPIPQRNGERAKEQKTRHFDIIEMGEGVVQMSHLFCPIF